MNINDTYKAFLLVSWLYLTTSTFTLKVCKNPADEVITVAC
jgi:hypothetical protein